MITFRPAGLSQGTKLPVIPTATGAENIPRFSSKEALGALRPIPDDAFEADDRIKMVESRLGASEKSNSVLLQEVIRLQGELRAMIRRNEEDIKVSLLLLLLLCVAVVVVCCCSYRVLLLLLLFVVVVIVCCFCCYCVVLLLLLLRVVAIAVVCCLLLLLCVVAVVVIKCCCNC